MFFPVRLQRGAFSCIRLLVACSLPLYLYSLSCFKLLAFGCIPPFGFLITLFVPEQAPAQEFLLTKP